MSNKPTISINHVELPIKEYNGKRVVTFKEIDTVHERPDGTARKRFNANRKHFIDGVDYFIISQPSEIRTLGIERPQGGTPERVTLVTESGYLMLVKSFNDDVAWIVQRQLVNTYFQATKEQRREATEQTMADEQQARLEAASRRADAMLLNAKNRTMALLRRLYTDAGVSPEHQALALNGLFADEGIALNRDVFRTLDVTYDKGTIAKKLGVYSASSGGKTPRAQAIGAIISQLPISENEMETMPYCRNGHDGVDVQYKESVIGKVRMWLEEKQFPSTILSNGKRLKVVYKLH